MERHRLLEHLLLLLRLREPGAAAAAAKAARGARTSRRQAGGAAAGSRRRQRFACPHASHVMVRVVEQVHWPQFHSVIVAAASSWLLWGVDLASAPRSVRPRAGPTSLRSAPSSVSAIHFS